MLLALCVGILAGIGLFLYGFAVSQRQRLVETTPTSTIRSLAVGLVEVAGTTASVGDPLTAPFSGLPCVYFSYKVEEQHGSGDSRQSQTLAEGSSDEAFIIKDATGGIMVFSHGADLMLQDSRTYRNDLLGNLPDSVIAGIARLGIATSGWVGQKTLRCHESCLLPSAPVFILGTAQENIDAPHQTQAASRLFIGKGHDQQFLISDQSEKDLLARWTWQAHALFYAGPALTVACLFALFKWYVTVGGSP